MPASRSPRIRGRPVDGFKYQDYRRPQDSAPGPWVVLPTYNEIENLAADGGGDLAALPQATLLVVDDNSPDGTGQLADSLAARDPRIRVRHRTAKQGLGRPTWTASASPSRRGRMSVIQMDADFSHDPAALPSLLAPLQRRGRPRDRLPLLPRAAASRTGLSRRVIRRGGRLFSRIVLGLRQPRSHRRLQGLARGHPRGASRSTASTPAATYSRSR